MVTSIEHEMWKAGYVLASTAAELVGVSATGTIYRAIERGELKEKRVRHRRFVTLVSLLAAYGSLPFIAERIRKWRPAPPAVARPKAKRVRK